MSEFALKLSEPAWLSLQSADGSATAKIDVYKARRVLDESTRAATEEQRWHQVNVWLASQLGCQPADLAESTALEFNDAIAAIVERLNDERKKKAGSIACLPSPTTESPPTTEHGP